MATARSALIVRQGELSAEDASRVSVAALDRPLEGDAELAVMAVTTGATVLGAFQRHHGALPSPPIVRRISGGAFVRVDRGTLHVVLALARPAALVACDARHIVNRYVRPLLRALTKSGALAHYFGRDWVSVAKRPVGQVGFAHDSRTGRAVFEAFVAVTHAFAPAGRASFLGKEPATLEAVTGRSFDLSLLQARIADTYAAEYERFVEPRPFEPPNGDSAPAPAPAADEPRWAASLDEVIGVVGAGADASGQLRLGGDLLASRDALDRVASRVAALPDDTADIERVVGAIVDQELSPTSVGFDGVRDLATVRDVLVRARAAAR